MPDVSISPEDRQAIYDNARQYAWNLDRADGPGVAGVFTTDGRILATGGRVYQGPAELADFVAQASSQPGFFGRQHQIQPLFIETTEGGYVMTSYWMVVTWHAEEAPFIVSLGWYRDVCVKEDGAWRFKEKTINRWDSTTSPPLSGR